jgi:hypothetical protein
MKRTLASVLMVVSPGLMTAAHAAGEGESAAGGKGARPVAAAKAKTQPPASSRVQLHSAATQVAAGIRAAEAALTPAELAIAEQVHVGTLPCELGASVHVEGDARWPGYFNVHGKGFRYRMHPIETSTGAIRLEDKRAGAVWLQLANKSMLMDQKAGRRVADECVSPAQVAFADALKKNPPPSLIDMSQPESK